MPIRIADAFFISYTMLEVEVRHCLSTDAEPANSTQRQILTLVITDLIQSTPSKMLSTWFTNINI